MASSIVCVDKLSYCYENSDLVLHDLSFEISEGEFVAVMGPSGAGKTTLALALNGIIPNFVGGHFFGSVKLMGHDTLDLSVAELAQHVGTVFQDPETQLVANTVEDEIAFGLENVKTPPDEIRRRIAQVLKIVRLEGCEHKHPNSLSGGQKQRLAIAAALALHPRIMILDEPTSQLDPMGAEEVFAVVRELDEQYDMTVILVTHDSERVAEYADRVLLLHEGRLRADCSPSGFFQQTALLAETALRPPQVTDFYIQFDKTVQPMHPFPTKFADAVEQMRRLWPALTFTPQPYQDAAVESQGEAIISVRDLHFSYPDGTKALRGISLDVRQAECVGIIGQNGGGKSTLLKHFLRLLSPSSGKVTIFGRDVADYTVSQLARRIGYVYQNPDTQIFSKSVEDEVRFGPANQIKDRAEVDRRVHEALEEMDLLDVAEEHPLALSKGDRERVAVATVLALDPEVLIFDEPTTGQDHAGAMCIMNMIRRLHHEGRTILVITHHLHYLPDYVDRVVLMGEGQLLLDAPIRHALNEVDLLHQTYLMPPQIVEFVQQISQLARAPLQALTTAEAIRMFVNQER